MNRLNQFTRVVNFIKPPRAYSWQTLVLMSIFFWILALLFGYVGNNLNLHNFFSFLGCTAVVSGFAWFSMENPLIIKGFSLSAWIWGELVCLFLASSNKELAQFAWVIWPVLSAIFATWPEFLTVERKVQNLSYEKRIKLLIWLLSHFVISCWIQFSLIIHNWVLQYPSLLADNFSQSNYVVKIQPFSPPNTGGEKVLDAMERQLKVQIDGKAWALGENWLKNTSQQEKLQTEAKKQIFQLKEKDMWKFRTEVSAQKIGYNLLMIAEWQGPSSHPQGYLLKKVCQANSVTRQPTPAKANLRRVRRNNTRVARTPQVELTAKPVKVAVIQCQDVTKEIIEQNQPQNPPSI